MSKQITEKDILMATRDVFLRYGYKKTTMGDIAKAAGISRPALYLIFPSKEDAFSATFKQIFDEQLRIIRNGLDGHEGVYEKLVYAFDIWCIEPYKIVLANPDAKDLLENSYTFAPNVTKTAWTRFESVLTDIIKVTKQPLESKTIAHLLSSSVLGLKANALSVGDLRQMIKSLLILLIR